MDRIRLFQALGDDPIWIHLVPAGSTMAVDGRGPFTLSDAAKVIAASMAGGKLAVDVNHSTDLAAPQGLPAPAVGWIVELAARADGLWGRVEWTASGKALLADKAYRAISPVLLSQKDTGVITKVLRASLVNDPAFPQLKTLHNKDTAMDLALFRNALGLSVDANETAILAAIKAAKEGAVSKTLLSRLAKAAGIDAAKAETVEALETQIAASAASVISRLAKAAGADPAKIASVDALETHIATLSKGESDETKQLREKIVLLSTQVETMAGAAKRRAAEAFIDKAIADGKPIKALRDHYVTRHMADAAAVEKEVGALVSIHEGGIVQPPQPAEGAAALTAEQKAICKAMGLDEAAYAKTLAAMRS